MIWRLLSGQLNPQPTRRLQFRWNALSSTIEDEELQINLNAYKLSTLSSMQTTQQAQKAPNLCPKENRNPK